MLQAGSRRMVRCPECRLVYRSPRPPEAEGSQAAAEDLREMAEAEWLGARRARNFRRFLDGWAGPPGRLLDVGCGAGWFLQMARERGWEALGVDTSPEAVRYARERLAVPAQHGDLKSVHFPANTFTLVTLWNVLEFVPDPLGLLREIHRVLAPGGRLFVRTQNYFFQRLSLALTGWAFRQERPYRTFVFHLNSFSPAPLRLLLRKTGFVPVRVTNSVPTWGDPYQTVRAAEPLMVAVKLGVHGLVQGLYFLSGRRWVLGPSLEAWALPEGEG